MSRPVASMSVPCAALVAGGPGAGKAGTPTPRRRCFDHQRKLLATLPHQGAGSHRGRGTLLFVIREMRNMQSTAREHTQRVFQETEKLRNQLAEKESNIRRRSRELNEQVAQTDMKRRKLEEERKKNADQNDSLNMARIEQQKADERVLQLLEKHNEEKEVALNKILQLDRQVDEKQKLEIDIEQLKGKLVVVKHIEGEGVDVKKHSEEQTEQLIERIEEMEDLEALNHALAVQHWMANDEIRAAKKELITGLTD